MFLDLTVDGVYGVHACLEFLIQQCGHFHFQSAAYIQVRASFVQILRETS